MMARLEAEALRADLASVEALLRERTPEQDPVGWFQFNQRKTELESKLAELRLEPGERAAVTLYFGGRPVIGSRGIMADFGAKALESFQTLVATRFAALEGPLGKRGRVPQRDRSALMITEVAHGSFGFVLEEADPSYTPELPVTSLKDVVEEVCGLIYGLATPMERDGESENLPEVLDRRILGSVQSFFQVLDDAGATLRVIGEHQEFSLTRDMIVFAKERSNTVNVDERTELLAGRLFLLPDARRFELHPIDGGASLRGSIAPQALVAVTTSAGELAAGVAGNVARVEMQVRELKFQHEEGRRSYQLLRIEPLTPPRG